MDQAWGRRGHPLGFREIYRELLEVQAHRLKKALLGKEAYTPYYLRLHQLLPLSALLRGKGVFHASIAYSVFQKVDIRLLLTLVYRFPKVL